MKKHLLTEDLDVLQHEKSDICISIIIPLQHDFADQNTAHVDAENCIRIVQNRLLEKYDAATVDPYLQNLEDLYQQLATASHMQGAGLFVSANVKKLWYYHFPVRTSVTIDRVFNIRQIIYEYNHNIPYAVLLLSEKEVRCFHAALTVLTEIKDNVFPLQFNPDHTYPFPASDQSNAEENVLQRFEKDKSATEEIRLTSFYREASSRLPLYIPQDTPLVIIGAVPDLGCFRKVAKGAFNIAEEIHGNYMHYNLSKLGVLTWKHMQEYIGNSRRAIIAHLQEQYGKRLTITGGLNIWRAVMDDRGLRLLVEKDYMLPGFFADNNSDDPQFTTFQHLHHMTPDMINLIIYLVLKKDGEVMIVENEELKDFNRLVLIARY
ncbi:hypothetical protein [Chitinophaga sp.]|uniref:baeRF3 domain-containing protein n=1 Tax=Chitinophaga sp. TaxID=1869181 RepID=UPI0031D403DC